MKSNVVPFRRKEENIFKVDEAAPLQSVIEHAQNACEAGRESIINQHEWGFLIMEGVAWMFNIRGEYAIKVFENGARLPVSAKGFKPTHVLRFSAEYYQQEQDVLPMVINVHFESNNGKEENIYQVPETSIRGVLATLVTITGRSLELS